MKMMKMIKMIEQIEQIELDKQYSIKRIKIYKRIKKCD